MKQPFVPQVWDKLSHSVVIVKRQTHLFQRYSKGSVMQKIQEAYKHELPLRVKGFVIATLCGLLIGGTLSLVGCSTNRVVRRGKGKIVTISLQKLSCQSCGQAVVRALRQRPGVLHASFAKDKVEVTVRYSPAKMTSAQLLSVVKQTGYQGVLGAGKGAYLPHITFKPSMNVQWLSKNGENVNLKRYLVPGKVTVFDFYADWCGPCREVDREMFRLLLKHQDIALRKLNVVDWKKPLARRYLTRVSSLPYVIVYGRKGRLIRKISGLKLKK